MEENMRLITAYEAADMLNIKYHTLARWRMGRKNTPNLPYVKVGRHVKYKLKDVRDFINKNRNERGE